MSADTPAVLAGQAQNAFQAARDRLERLRDVDPTFASDLAVRWVASLAVGFVQLEDRS